MNIDEKEKYLIVIDLGKTLLPDSDTKHIWTINKEDFNAIKWCIENGHEVVLATGRIKEVSFEIYDFLKLNSYLILENGKEIYDSNKKILVSNKNWDKFDAIQYINNSQKKVISFGDGDVDERLLDGSEHPFLMKNGKMELFKDNYNITKFTNNESGVGKTLIEFLK